MAKDNYMKTRSSLTGEALLAHARDALVKEAQNQMRHGPDMTRNVKAWPRMQTQWSLKGDASSEMLAEGSKRVSTWPSFVREAFGRLYTGDRCKELKPHAEHAWATQMHSMLNDLPEWQRLTQRCRGDSYATTAATVGVGQKVVGQVPSHQKDARDARRRVDMMEEEWEDMKQEAQDQGEPPPRKPPELTCAHKDLSEAIQESVDLANQIDPSAARQAVRAAVSEVNEELDKIDSTLRGLGWGSEDAGPGQESAAAVKEQVAQRLAQAPRLKEIMDLAGRLKNIMRESQSAKVRHGCSELTDIETGAEVDRLLPSELAMLRNPKGKLLLARKLFERSAMQYHLEGKDKVGRGPLVVCIDDSGSMSGQREVWSKALALALLELARKQNRSFAYCLFSNRLVHEFTEPKGTKAVPATVLDAILTHSGGGTAFDPPLRWSLDQIDKEDRLKDADVIFISDGDCRAKKTSEHKARIKKLGCRVWGIALGGSAIHATGEGSMRTFCERIWPITDLRADNPTEEEDAAARGVLGV